MPWKTTRHRSITATPQHTLFCTMLASREPLKCRSGAWNTAQSPTWPLLNMSRRLSNGLPIEDLKKLSLRKINRVFPLNNADKIKCLLTDGNARGEVTCFMTFNSRRYGTRVDLTLKHKLKESV